ncbi:DUF2800 domain-containing protein [Limosilactobacillus vaginalis]|uniref:DUF2800 domain-containing protein n=1 Tax=Limosilactobacillus vaginalis TaxID=1633 RepID=A0AAW5WUS3_9LACO|nr:DUF2800 domain-containing protein [Limosilactobacillus vaginalis]MCZ3668187.1 DUF2800 domain-containing protein [Limosilactobacillus vaginalis]
MSSPTNHALLSASSAHRWLSAPPLPRLEQFFPHSTSNAAAEGTAAHALGEYKVHRALGHSFKRPTSNYQCDEMEAYTDDYCSYVLEQFEVAKQYAKDPTISLEQKLDFSKYVPEGFGTGDCVIVSDHLLHIIDFKYGKGVKVDATDNPQMKLYAIGALEMFGELYDIDEVETTIFQPRMANISTWSIPIKELIRWANTTLKEKAELAFAGQGTVRYGPWCQFSNCNAVLRARYDYHHQLERFQLASPHLLTDAEVAEVLEHVDDLNRWAHEVKAYAADLAINHGKKWPGFKLVEGRSIRHYRDEGQVAATLQEAGYTDIYQKKLLPITKLEAKLGKKKFNQLLGKQIYKPAGKPTLVADDDPRANIAKSTPADEFKEEK